MSTLQGATSISEAPTEPFHQRCHRRFAFVSDHDQVGCQCFRQLHDFFGRLAIGKVGRHAITALDQQAYAFVYDVLIARTFLFHH